MAEWLYEEGIGENRAILVEDCEIIEAEIELPGAIRAGAVLPARLTRIQAPTRRGVVALGGGGEALLEPLPAGVTEGASLRVEIVREAIPDAENAKLARARATDDPPRNAPPLAERIGAQPRPTLTDRFEAAGWSIMLEEAATGLIAFPDGRLRMSLTPAMTLFDVDGTLPADELMVAGAAAAARAIRRLGVTGSIGLDLPTSNDREARRRAAEAVDAALPRPFERTAVNGFGFLQIVRRRSRLSLPEMVQGDPVGAAARALLRRAEWAAGAGELALSAAPAVIARLEAEPDWLALLARRIAAPVVLRPRPGLAISAGHAQRRQT